MSQNSDSESDANILLKREGDKLAAYDKETGEPVPIEINGVPMHPDGTIDVEHVDGAVTETSNSWTLNDDGALEPVNDRAVSIDELFTKSDGADIIVWQDSGTTYAADESGLLHSGDAATVIDTVCDSNRGSHILVGPGDYLIDVSVLSQSWTRIFDCTLEGVNRQQVTFTAADGTDPFAVFRGRSQSAIKSLTIDGNRLNNASGHGFEANGRSEVRVEDVEVQKTADNGLALQNDCTDSVVVDCHIHDTDGFAVRASGSRNRIEGVYADSTKSITAVSGSDATVTNSIVTNPIDQFGIVLNFSLSDSEVSNCRVDAGGSASWGIGVSQGCQGCTIANCTVRGAVEHGITIDTNTSDDSPEPGDHTISGCVSHDNGAHGINIQNTHNTTISGCTAFGNSNAGLRVTGTESENCTVTSCRSRSNTDGLVVDAENCSASGNVLLGNTNNLVDNTTNGIATAANVT